MSLQNQFLYYRNKTNIYKNIIEKNAESIISNKANRSKYYLESEDLNEISKGVLCNLKRIINEIKKKEFFTEEDIINMNIDLTIIKNQIQNDIIDKIRNKNFNVYSEAKGIAITKSK